MIFDKKSLYSRKKAVRYFRLPTFENPAKAVNAYCGRDRLGKSRGFRKIGAPAQGIKGLALYAAGKSLYCSGDDGKIYYMTEGGAFAPLSGDARFLSPPAFCDVVGSSPVRLFSDGVKVCVALSGGLYPSEIPPFSAACYSYERLWIYADGKLRFSAPLHYESFADAKNGGGEIALPDGRGEILALIPFDNRIYLFRERGIQKLDVRGEQTDFEITDFPFFGERILKNTIACGEECVYFCTEAGMYRLADGGVSAFNDAYFAKYKLRPIKGAYAEGAYHLLAESGIDGEGERAVHVFYGNGSISYHGSVTDICALCRDNAIVCACIEEGEIGVLEAAPSVCTKWTSDWSDLGGGARKKVLERVVLRGKGFFLLHISGEGIERTSEVRFVKGKAELNVGLASTYFEFTLETDSGEAEIYELSCLYTLSKGGKL